MTGRIKRAVANNALSHRPQTVFAGSGSSMKKEKRRRRRPANGRHRFEAMRPDVSKRSDRNA
jgi:hypothetical protein